MDTPPAPLLGSVWAQWVPSRKTQTPAYPLEAPPEAIQEPAMVREPSGRLPALPWLGTGYWYC
jgi:hypothetical protein